MSDAEVRKQMILFREHMNMSKKSMARYIGISPMLLSMVEVGHVTHPRIAERIGKAYQLTALQTEMLMPVNYRKHGPDYDPMKYWA